MPQLSIVKSEPLQIVSSEAAQPSVMEMGRQSAQSGQAEAPGFTEKFAEMLGPLAHPETLTDFARLLTLPVDSVRKALAATLTAAAAKQAASSVADTASRVRVDPKVAVNEFSLNQPQRVLKAVTMRPKPAPAAEGFDRYMPNQSAPAAAAPTPAAAPIAAAPVEASAAVPAAAQSMSPQRILNELAIQGRRQGVVLTGKDYTAAAQAVQQGSTPEEVVAALKALKATPAAAQTPAEALAARFGTPTDQEVGQVVMAKNAKTTVPKGGTKR